MCHAALLLLALTACSPNEVEESGTPPGTVDPAGFLSRDDGWRRGDLHMHTEWSDGWDDVATVIAIGEYLEDPEFLAYHPEYEGNGLDFIAITDHRTVDGQADPDYHSDRLVLLGGEEFGSPGHAGVIGVHTFVDHDPDDDGTTLADIQAGVQATHDQGAVFSPNHPFYSDIPFPWDFRDHDALEVWNSGWGLMAGEMTRAYLDEWEASHGAASPLYVRALDVQGQGCEQQALAWYEVQLSRGIHVALVGGSDRHVLLMVGFPTTWIRAGSYDEAGLVQGIRDRHTFVSRTPASAQVAVEIDHDGVLYEMGDEVAIPATGADVPIRVRVGRSDGSLVRVIQGSAVESDEVLATATLGQVVFESPVSGVDATFDTTLSVQPGDWFYVTVLDSLVAPGLTDDQAAFVEGLASETVKVEKEDWTSLAAAVGDIIEGDALGNADECDADDWEPTVLQCVTVDTSGMGTFFVPDLYDRALNATMTDGDIDGQAMGAVTSAVMFTAR